MEVKMKKDMIWAYLIHLSYHMWDDPHTVCVDWYVKNPYTESNGTDMRTWDSVVKYVAECGYNTLLIDVGDGIKYESVPEISAPDAWDKDLLRKKLREARALGLEVIPKLNFSCAHHTWLKKYGRMVGTAEYYSVCARLIKEVLEVFDYPRLIHFGMDEERQVSAIERRGIHVIRGDDIWWHDMFFYFGEAEKYGATPWVWSDFYWRNGDSFIKNMPKSAIQSNWFYQRFRKYPEGDISNKRISTYEELDALGFKQIPCASTCRGYDGGELNSVQTILHARERLNEDNVLGFMMAPWRNTVPLEEHYLKDAALRLTDARDRVLAGEFDSVAKAVSTVAGSSGSGEEQ